MARILDFLNREQPAASKQEIGIGNFTAFVRVRDSSEMSADVPTTPLEDGSMVNDHIILKPFILTIEGDVSDIHLRANPVLQQIQRAGATVGNVTEQYGPDWTPSMLQRANAIANDARDAVLRLQNVVDSGTQILSLFGNQDAGSKSIQEQFIDAMEALHLGRQIIAIDMPFRRRENMVITSFVTNTDNQTDDTTFSLRAQKVRFAEVIYSKVARQSPGVQGQLDDEVSKGAQKGKRVESSFVFSLIRG